MILQKSHYNETEELLLIEKWWVGKKCHKNKTGLWYFVTILGLERMLSGVQIQA